MSDYYNYYVGYMLDGKIYPWGPYSADGKLRPLICRSRSFASDLHEDFYSVREKAISEELRKNFEYSYNGETVMKKINYLPVDELPGGDGVRKGYFLITDVQRYERFGDEFDGFADELSPEVYAAKMKNEIIFGKNEKKPADEEEYVEPNASDYMYYAYLDKSSREYEASLLRNLVEALDDYRKPENLKYVILETEG